MVSIPEYVAIKEARVKENSIIILCYMLHKILPPQLKNMSAQYKVMSDSECFISSKSVH